jgi:hypothetical protein
VQQGERCEGDASVALPVPRFSHREVVRERDVGYSGGLNSVFHGEGYGRYAPGLYGFAYQADGPVAEWSGGG